MTFAAAEDFELTPVTVATRTGQDGRGAAYAAPVDREVYVEDGRKQVRGPDGDLTVSETTLYDTPDQAGLYGYYSQVTVNDRTSLVIAVKRRVIGDPDVDHLEINLT